MLVNVTNILRGERRKNTKNSREMERLFATEIEFLSVLELHLKEGNILSIATAETWYANIAMKNHVNHLPMYRKKLKQLINEEMPNVVIAKSTRVNEPDRLLLKTTCDKAVSQVADANQNAYDGIKTIFQVAKQLRSAVLNSKNWNFDGSLTSVSEDKLPIELLLFFKWFISGTSSKRNDAKTEIIEKRVQTLAQNAAYSCLSERQVTATETSSFYQKREFPQQVAVGLTVHQMARSKKIIEFLHGFQLSVDYTRVLQMENRIAAEIRQKMIANDNIYIPSNLMDGKFTFFAVDNVDFKEDTPDGKRTLHGTVMTVYQQVILIYNF